MKKRSKPEVVHKNGNKVYFDAKATAWRYVDDGGNAFEPRPCPSCKNFQLEDGRDYCMPKLTGVVASCCGHGVKKGFIEFEDGSQVEVSVSEFGPVIHTKN